MEIYMLRHAYLIMIHEYSLVLERLIQLLDDEHSDLYLHIDRRSRHVDEARIRRLARKSEVRIYRKYKVYWGTNSITLAEMFLLGKAVPKRYDYYHVLSGADLPIKPKREIQAFFEKNKGKEFIHFGTPQYQRDISERYAQYHFFTRQLGRRRDKKLWVDAETYSLAIQRRLRIDRARKRAFSCYGGANWCSITGGLARYAVRHYKKYKKAFRFTQISDELIWQTIVLDSPFKGCLYQGGFTNDYNACVRCIDWNRGAPYVFRSEDFRELMESDCMFARKFDEKTDRKIIEMIYEALGERSGE